MDEIEVRMELRLVEGGIFVFVLRGRRREKEGRETEGELDISR